MTKFVVAAAVLLFSVACAATGTGTGANPTPTPTRGAGMHYDVTATEEVHDVTMRVGQTLEVVLHGGDVMGYQQVRTSDATILAPTVDPTATAAKFVTRAAFQAKAPGVATVTAVGLPVCPSGQACPMYAMIYTLTVKVTP